MKTIFGRIGADREGKLYFVGPYKREEEREGEA